MEKIDWSYAKLVVDIMDAKSAFERHRRKTIEAIYRLQEYVDETRGTEDYDPEWVTQLQDDINMASDKQDEILEQLLALLKEGKKYGIGIMS